MSAKQAHGGLIEYFAIERDRLVRYVRRLIADAAERDGEDIVQDVALNLFNRADISIPVEYVSAYVYQAIRNRVIDYLRRRKDLISLDEPLGSDDDFSLSEMLVDPNFDAEEMADRSEVRQRIIEAIDDLSDEQKAVFIETEIHGRSFQDLSAAWGVPIGTLLSRKSRATTKVRAALQDLRP